MTERKPNALANESSPYLLQHAHNPVDWMPWGDTAFDKARAEDKLVFLSIGYATCHWCHVMERESFENEEIAGYLNEHFVSIKVDREERPDIDAVYMAVTQALNDGRGGWPMSLWLTPDRKPVTAGTYFPPNDRFGRAGFLSVLKRMVELWEKEREKLIQQAADITDWLQKQAAPEGEGELTTGVFDTFWDTLANSFDERYGGFERAPKFPTPHRIQVLLRRHKQTGDPEPLRLAEHTLQQMAYGGIHDHVGGGFHRYSTDREWLTPHFEKMLYDQALLLEAYLDAYLLTGKKLYSETAHNNCGYVLRDLRDESGALIPDLHGRYYRQWRDHIRNPDDIWQEIVRATQLPGLTSAPKLQPIETRLVMLQTGMRAPMGVKVKGPDLEAIEAFGLELEKYLKQVEGVKAPAVFADRIVGKPYLEFQIDRAAIARHGLTIEQVQRHIQAAVGGMAMTTTVEGRERYAVRVRYPRELRNDPEDIERVLLPSKGGGQIPLGDLIDIRYRQGPQSIKSEDNFLIGYVLFDREPEYAEVTVVENAQRFLREKIENGDLIVPAGVSYRFAGTYEQQVRASKRLGVVLPVALGVIFLILYFQFRSVAVTTMVFSGVFVAFSGGFIMIWLYGQDWFLNFELFGNNMRDLMQVHPINLSVAVWVGFLALFGVATDDGVLVATFLRDSFRRNEPDTVEGIRQAVVEGGLRRVRPATMTTATTILALLPVLTSTGRGADVMVPMAIPSFGGMTLQMLTMFTVPILYSLWKELQLSGRKWIEPKKEKDDKDQ